MKRGICSFPLSLGLALAVGLSATSVGAEVILDGTMGQAGALTGPDYAVTADLGRQVGGNLFHSFAEFNLAQGESATFSGPASVTNIIARVTGGHPSSIDGLLRSEIVGADLYLLNPAGLLFGPHASLDLKGGFHVSTADYLRLGAAGRFDARQPADSELSADPPADFGFLGDSAAEIRFSGATLAVPEGQSISIVSSGSIVIEEGSSLLAASGTVFLTSRDHSLGQGSEANDEAGATLAMGTSISQEVHPSSEKLTIDGQVRVAGSYDKSDSRDTPGVTVYDERVQLGVNSHVTPPSAGYIQLEANDGASAPSPTAVQTGAVHNTLSAVPQGLVKAGGTIRPLGAFYSRPTPHLASETFASPLLQEPPAVGVETSTAFGF